MAGKCWEHFVCMMVDTVFQRRMLRRSQPVRKDPDQRLGEGIHRRARHRGAAGADPPLHFLRRPLRQLGTRHRHVQADGRHHLARVPHAVESVPRQARPQHPPRRRRRVHRASRRGREHGRHPRQGRQRRVPVRPGGVERGDGAALRRRGADAQDARGPSSRPEGADLLRLHDPARWTSSSTKRAARCCTT